MSPKSDLTDDAKEGSAEVTGVGETTADKIIPPGKKRDTMLRYVIRSIVTTDAAPAAGVTDLKTSAPISDRRPAS